MNPSKPLRGWFNVAQCMNLVSAINVVARVKDPGTSISGPLVNQLPSIQQSHTELGSNEILWKRGP